MKVSALQDDMQLVKNDALIYKVELQSRMAPILLSLLLAVLAVPISQTSPRQGRYIRMGFGLIFYVVFTNLISVGKSWMMVGKVPAAAGFWWIYAIMLMLIIFLVMQQIGFRYLFGRENKA